MKNKKFQKALIFAVLAVAVIAMFDVIAAHSGVFGSVTDYTNGNYTPGWWMVFYQFNLFFLASIPILYYFLVRKDYSESIAIFFTSYTLWTAGLADALYFIFQGKMIPETLSWLMGSLFIGKVAMLLHAETVTRTVLLVSIAAGFGIVYIADKFFERLN